MRRVLQQFRRQRPLRAGSLLITLFGDAIAPRGGVVTLGSLIRLGAAFGLTERLVRTSVARLAADGWLTARRSGRRSEYRLTASGAARFREATRRIYGPAPRRWDGRWALLLLPAGGRREKAREALRWLGFGQLHGALFAHPRARTVEVRQRLRSLRLPRGALLLESRAAERAADRQLISQGWDLAQLARRYRRFMRRFAPLEAQLRASPAAPAVAFMLRTLLIHEYRKIHLQDPLLPAALLPRDWVGTAAYRLCRRLYGRLFRPAERHLVTSAARLARPLPPLARATYRRFGGISPRRRRRAGR
jgi:phenylacetic acid degradation operon negative regulatory protein